MEFGAWSTSPMGGRVGSHGHDESTLQPHVRVALFGPRGGWLGATELSPYQARIFADELLRAAREAENGPAY